MSATRIACISSHGVRPTETDTSSPGRNCRISGKQNPAFSEVLGFDRLSFARVRGRMMFGHMVTGNYFQMLGVNAAMGRTLLPGDDGGAGSAPVAVLSSKAWANKFGGDPGDRRQGDRHSRLSAGNCGCRARGLQRAGRCAPGLLGASEPGAPVRGRSEPLRRHSSPNGLPSLAGCGATSTFARPEPPSRRGRGSGLRTAPTRKRPPAQSCARKPPTFPSISW